MALNRSSKERIVGELNKKFKEASSVFVTDYRGLKVVQMEELRRRLRKESIEYIVVKNTLLRLAAKDTGLEVLSESFEGPVALAFGSEDSVSAAKILTEFSKEEPDLELKTGYFEDKVCSVEEINALALLPGRDILLGMLVGALKANLSALVNVLQGVPRGLLSVLKAVEEKKGT